MRLSDLDYELPSELIAQHPVKHREQSRLLVLDRASQTSQHHQFCELVDFLKAGDLLVLNDTKVMPARLMGRRRSGGKVEVLVLNPDAEGQGRYHALIKPLARLKKDEEILFDKNFSCRLIDPQKKIVLFEKDNAHEVMEKVGRLPLPPYIRREPTREDARRYQTVFADKSGAVAAPTAGLHFSKKLIAVLKKKGVTIAFLTLHVNYATFAPVRSEDVRAHQMHPEYYEIPGKTVACLREVRKNRGRIVAVGTTVCKALEDSGLELFKKEAPVSIARESRLFIYPPFTFHVVDALITNFHLPRTSLLALIAAFAGHAFMQEAYREAVHQRYRFYSYGDAMLIL